MTIGQPPVVDGREDEEPEDAVVAGADASTISWTPSEPDANAPAPPFIPGASIQGGRYRLIRLIGRGGMGWVFEANDEHRLQRVALKVLRDAQPARDFELKREFRSLADLHHPNLVRMHELGREGDRSFIVMELVDGTDFVSHVRPRGTPGPDVDRLRSALGQLVSAVQALHDSGRLHRDLKPSNVLVDRSGRVVVLDFGLVHETRTHLYEAQLAGAGTPGFMAPEQARGHAVIAASDWYSVGVILFQALTGERPHAEQSDVMRLGPVPPDLAGLAIELLDDDPSERPGGAAIAARLALHGAVSAPRLQTTFVGRSADLQRLRDALLRAQEGRPGRVVVAGPSGIGKTALVTAFLAEAAQRGAVVLAGKCHERDTIPYKALDTIVDELSRYLCQMPAHELAPLLPHELPALLQVFPVLARVPSLRSRPPPSTVASDPAQLRERALSALKELLHAIGQRATLVLFIDDLQWGDEDSARLLLHLMAPPDAPRLLLIVAYRSASMGAGRAVDLLLASSALPGEQSRAEHVSLSALSPVESRELVGRLLASRAAAAAACGTLAQECGGNPFFAHELALAWLEREEPGSAGQESLSLTSLLRKRVVRLPAPAAELLELTVIASRPPRVEVLRRALSAGAAELWPAIDLLKFEGLVHGQTRAATELVAPSHDPIRGAVEAELDPQRRIRRHRQLADAIQAVTPDEHDVLFEHLLGAGSKGPAGECAVRAGDAAARVLAFERAAQFFRTALELLPDERALELGVERRLADVLAAAGHSKEAARVYLELERRTDDDRARAELLRCAGVHALAGGDEQTGVAAFEQLFAILQLPWPHTDEPGLLERTEIAARSMSYTASALRRIEASPRDRDHSVEQLDALFAAAESLVRYHGQRAFRLSLRFAALALRTADPARRAHACVLLGNAWLAFWRTGPQALSLFARAAELADQAGDPHALGAARASQALAHNIEGRFAQAAELAEQAERLTYGVPEARIMHENAVQLRVSAYLWQGKLRAADRELALLVTQARERGHTFASELSPRPAAEYEAEAARREHPAWQALRNEPVLRHADCVVTPGAGWRWESWMDLLGALHRDDLARAFELEQRLAGDRLWSLLAPVQRIYARGHIALARAARDPDPALLATARRSAGKLERLKLGYARAFAALLRAGVAALARETAAARLFLSDAADGFAGCDMLLHAHCARRALGSAIGGASGDTMIAEADAFMREQGIADLDRWTRCYVPGFDRLVAR